MTHVRRRRFLRGTVLAVAVLLLPACTSADGDGDEDHESPAPGARGSAPVAWVLPEDVDLTEYPIVFAQASAEAPDLDLYATTPAGREPVQVTGGRWEEAMAAWSPDGKRIVFVAAQDFDHGPSDVYVADVGSGLLKVLTPGDGCAGSPSWSPDGTRVMYEAGTCGEAGGSVYVVDADGGDPRLVVHGPVGLPQWSPDGRIVYTVARGRLRGRLVVTDGAGRHPVAVADLGYEAAWSPDGTRIAYVAPTRDTGSLCFQDEDVFVVGADGTGRRQLTRSAGNDHWRPAWSPNGKQVLYTADDPGPCEVLGNLTLVVARTLERQPLFPEPCQCAYPDWRRSS